MRVHIVNPYRSQAMARLSGPLHELARLYEVTESDKPESADVLIHVPWHTVGTSTAKQIAMYTHCNPGDEARLIEACNKADIVTAMSFTGRKELLNYGVDPRKIWVTPSAADGFLFRRRVVLVVGNVQPNGRKRENILLDLAWQYDLSAYEFLFIGYGWGALTEQLTQLGVRAVTTQDLTEDKIRDAYRMADVLLVTGYAEGGPLPLLEAMGCGTPVLSPRYGYAADYLESDDIYTDVQSLYERLQSLDRKAKTYHQIVQSWRWMDYAAEYALLIGRLTGQSLELYPEYGAARYAQLLDVIDQYRPQRIAEIGTWNGNRAIQMIQQAGKYHDEIWYQGFDLFEQQTGEQFTRELSKQGQPFDVVKKRIEATGASVQLVAGDTRDTARLLHPADLYFVDGGHSERTIENDSKAVLQLLRPGAVAVFDDYYHSGKPEGVGCNKFVDGLPDEYEITHLPARTHASDGREIGMVMVCQRTYIETKRNTNRN